MGRLDRDGIMQGAHVHAFRASARLVGCDQPIAFVDRDGVLNHGREGYVNHADQLILLPGAADAVAQLNRAGFAVCVVTNQSPVMRGLWGLERLESIHDHLQSSLLEVNPEAILDAVITCPHRRRDMCSCRKPQPGMLHLGERLLRHRNASLNIVKGLHTFVAEEVDWWSEKPTTSNHLDAMVGDRRSDMGAGWAYGARLFRVNAHLGLVSAVARIVDVTDPGDDFQP